MLESKGVREDPLIGKGICEHPGNYVGYLFSTDKLTKFFETHNLGSNLNSTFVVGHDETTSFQLIRANHQSMTEADKLIAQTTGFEDINIIYKVFAISNMKRVTSNKVELLDSKDYLGCRRLKVEVSMSRVDRQVVEHNIKEFAKFLWEADFGFLKVDPTMLYNAQIGLGHLMGGTVMSEDPMFGVVDSDLRCHRHPNLFILGSSVFPNGGGSVNPTASIAALGFRLGDKVSRE